MYKHPKLLTLREQQYVERWALAWGAGKCSTREFHEALYAVYGVQ